MARLRHTTGLRSTNPMYGAFRAVKPRIGIRCTASGDLCIRTSGINRVLFSYCFRQFLCFRSDTHCFDCWRLVRDFTVTASLTVYNGNFNVIRHEGSKVARNCMDASAIFIINTRNLNPNPQRDRGSPHTPVMQGGRPKQHQETRNPNASRRRSRTPPPAARRVVFHEGMDRGHGGPNDPPAKQTSSAADPRRRSKRPRSERTSPPFPRRLSECDRQRCTQAPNRQQTVRPARRPPPSQGPRPARYWGDDQGDPRPTSDLNRG